MPLTPVRQLPRATKNVTKREVRLIVAKEPNGESQRRVDLTIAPLKHPEVTGERVLYTAMEAGVRDNIFVHGVFDMGSWPCQEFLEQLWNHDHLATVDIIHVTEYLCEAGKSIVGLDEATAWGMAKKELLLLGEVDSVIDSLRSHECTPGCLVDEHGNCLAKVALGYLTNHRGNLNYPEVLERGLPVGSGEAESGIRHLATSDGCRRRVEGGECHPGARTHYYPRQRLVSGFVGAARAAGHRCLACPPGSVDSWPLQQPRQYSGKEGNIATNTSRT